MSREYLSEEEIRRSLHRLREQGSRFNAILSHDFGYVHRDTIANPKEWVAALLHDPEAVDELRARGWEPKP
jgi:hypothetical protein